MWDRTIDRARRRLRPPAVPAVPTPDVATAVVVDDLVLALTRPEKIAFTTALAAAAGADARPLDSPAGLADGVARAIERIGGCGRASVTRSPAGLYTPEYWHIRVDGADRGTRAELERLAGGRRFE